MIRIGTSGWSYPHWEKAFYPPKTPATKKLSYYATVFDCVEINTTFYHLPLKKSVENWAKTTPKGFIFAVKASRYITHQKRLIDCEKPLETFFKSVEPLKQKLGPILFQLPPSFEINLPRLEAFLKLLGRKKRYVFEFRNESWFTSKTYALLKKYHVALVYSHLNGKVTPNQITSDFVYMRLHGPKGPYSGSYSKNALLKWKKMIQDWQEKGLDIYCFFDNDEKGYAVLDAMKLIKNVSSV